MAQYTDKWHTVEAFQLPQIDDHNTDPFINWAEKHGLNYECGRDGSIIFIYNNLKGEEIVKSVQPGEYIVKGKLVPFIVMQQNLFEDVYS